MIAALALALALQSDPQIEKVERLTGDVNRPLLWVPLKVTVSSAAGFDGDLSAASDFNFRTARRVALAPGGRATVLLPAIDPKEIVAGKTVYRMPRDFVRPDRVVLVDSRRPYASDLVSTPQVLYQKISPEDYEATWRRGLLEAGEQDLNLLEVVTQEDLEKRVASIRESPEALEAVDRSLWLLAPHDGWMPSKKSWALYFAVVYAFAAFMALAVLARRFPKFGLACVAGVAVLGAAGSAALFPRQQVWVVSERVDQVGLTGKREIRLWFVNAAAEVETSIQFPKLVKPVFASSAGTEDPFTIRIEDHGCRVEGLKVGPGRSACFASAGPFEPMPTSSADARTISLRRVVLVRDGRAMYLGDDPRGDWEKAEGESPVHRSPAYDAWGRFVGKNGVIGTEAGDPTATHDVVCPDLADERERPRTYIRRLK